MEDYEKKVKQAKGSIGQPHFWNLEGSNHSWPYLSHFFFFFLGSLRSGCGGNFFEGLDGWVICKE